MKKITRCTLDELAKRLPVIDEDEMHLYVGGGTGTPGDP